jgi:N-acyl-D-amino-acid deacylase
MRITTCVISLLLSACAGAADRAANAVESQYDVIIRHGTLYDGGGGVPRKGDVGIKADRIVALGDLSAASAKREIDATGLAVSPGFIDLISFSWYLWPVDSRALSGVYQGVTLEVFSEGGSPAPLTAATKQDMIDSEQQYPHGYEWSSLADYLAYTEKKGAGANFASFIGNSNVRDAVLGQSARRPTDAELVRMQEVVRTAMREGALGLGVGLTTPPGTFSSTEELTALAKVVAESDGVFEISLRSQSNGVLEAIDEAIAIAAAAKVRTHIGHIYAGGKDNWSKAGGMIDRINAARERGIDVSSSVYPYTEVWTYLTSVFPPWAHDGGKDALLRRLEDPKLRARIADEMQAWRGGGDGSGWEQYLALVESPAGVIFLRTEVDSLRQYQGRTLADFMRDRKIGSPALAAMEMVRENKNEIMTVFRTQSEENLRRFVRQPWVAMGSDAQSIATEGAHLDSPVHPRTYASATRWLEKFVREEQVLALPEAVRRLTALPAQAMGIRDRGRLEVGSFADIAVFDPAAVRERSTFAESHRYSEGMRHVLVNGQAVLSDGRHTGALPGRAVRGPGWRP